MREGRPPLPRAVQVVFWEAVRAGLSAEEAGRAAGVSHRMPYRWLSRAGGVKSNGPGPVSGRYLSLAERGEISVGGAARKTQRESAGPRVGVVVIGKLDGDRHGRWRPERDERPPRAGC